jgi:hypothetical protein
MVGFGQTNLIGDLTMTDEMMNLRELVEKTPDADLLGEMIGSCGRAADGAGGGRAEPHHGAAFFELLD